MNRGAERLVAAKVTSCRTISELHRITEMGEELDGMNGREFGAEKRM